MNKKLLHVIPLLTVGALLSCSQDQRIVGKWVEPIPGGAIDIVSEMRITSGWCLRPEGLTIVSMPYSA